MITNSTSDYPLAPVQFSRLARRGIMLGLSLPQLIVLGIAVLTVVFSLYTADGMGLAWTAPVWGTCALLAVIPAGGRKVIEWVPVLARWAARTYLGQLVYRRRVIKPRPAGTLSLPGDAAPLREWEDPETGAAMIHDPHAQTLTAILGVSHPAFVLLDPGEQQRRVSGWGRVLAAVGMAEADMDPDNISVYFNDQPVCVASTGTPGAREVDLSGADIDVRVDLGTGGAGTAFVRTTDLSHAYVEENSAYSS